MSVGYGGPAHGWTTFSNRVDHNPLHHNIIIMDVIAFKHICFIDIE